ncbi:unnamed protein product [Durusdinium trenchii]|uniref:Acyltransferase 3 domain-containing protein n=1 Tax=Durusdinium trenchii TaxID=1381693 RepID=A0ABP0LER1_9DINO
MVVAKPVVHGAKRLHELDWLRALMVIMVVYAHISTSGIRGGVHGKLADDDRIYNMRDPSTLGVRWISMVRQYCLPLLLFVSGAASACSFRTSPGNFGKILLYTLMGVSLNAVLWLLGPQDPSCDPGSGYGRAECHGAVFDFTVCPFSGKIFPIVFQMWYTALLVVLMLINWPLFAFLHSSENSPGCFSCGSMRCLLLQLLVTISLQVTLIISGDLQQPWLLIFLTVLCEITWIGLAVMGKRLPEYLRVIHYCLAALATLQFGCMPIADKIESISIAFVLFIFIGFNKSFQLGYILTLARLPGQDEAFPIVSLYWPMMVILRTLTAPSTNWYAAGNLTYPYYPRALDRVDYVAGAVIIMFVASPLDDDLADRDLPWNSSGRHRVSLDPVRGDLRPFGLGSPLPLPRMAPSWNRELCP